MREIDGGNLDSLLFTILKERGEALLGTSFSSLVFLDLEVLMYTGLLQSDIIASELFGVAKRRFCDRR